MQWLNLIHLWNLKKSLCTQSLQEACLPALAAALSSCVGAVILVETAPLMQQCRTTAALWGLCPGPVTLVAKVKGNPACFLLLLCLGLWMQDPGSWVLLLEYSTSHGLAFVPLQMLIVPWEWIHGFSVSLGLAMHSHDRLQPLWTWSFWMQYKRTYCPDAFFLSI